MAVIGTHSGCPPPEGLIVGERLIGVPGMVFAPVALRHLKVEAARIPAAPETNPISEVEQP
jgi:hypothetical protein